MDIQLKKREKKYLEKLLSPGSGGFDAKFFTLYKTS